MVSKINNGNPLRDTVSTPHVQERLDIDHSQLRLEKQAIPQIQKRSVTTSFDVKRQGINVGLSEINEAKNIMATAQGGLQRIHGNLNKMRDKLPQDRELGIDEKRLVEGELKRYRNEIDNTAFNTKWNGQSLLVDTERTGQAQQLVSLKIGNEKLQFSFQQGSNIAKGQNFKASTRLLSSDGLGLSSAALSLEGEDGIANVHGRLEKAAIVVKEGLEQIASFTQRLNGQEDTLSSQLTAAAKKTKRITDVDYASSTVDSTKEQILKDSLVASLAQANIKSIEVHSLFNKI